MVKCQQVLFIWSKMSKNHPTILYYVDNEIKGDRFNQVNIEQIWQTKLEIAQKLT